VGRISDFSVWNLGHTAGKKFMVIKRAEPGVQKFKGTVSPGQGKNLHEKTRGEKLSG